MALSEFDFDEEEDPYEVDEEIVVCPECGSDDLRMFEGETEYVCEDCGERFSAGEEED